MKKIRIDILMIVLATVVTTCVAGAQETIRRRVTSASQPDYVSTFHDLYEHLGAVYPNFEMKGIDWKAVGDEMSPRAAQVRDERGFGLLVLELVARLQDSHAVVEKGSAEPPAPDLPQWDPGIACLMDHRGRPVIYVVDARSPAEAAGVKVGMTIVSVNGTPAADAIKQWMQTQKKYFGYSSQRTLEYDAARAFFKQPDRGAKVTLELVSAEGTSLGVKTAADLGWRYIPRLPVPRDGIDDSANVSWKMLEHRVGYIYVRRIQAGLEQSLDQSLKDLGDIDGLILDIRGNSGGGFDPQTAIRNFDLAPTDTDEPERPRYRGRIAMLTDERTISAAEGWASWFVANKRARFFGTTTAGASSRKETYTLSNGLYQVIVPVKAYTGFLDRPIEVRGLEPDVPIQCNAKDISAGKDTVVDTARQWLIDQAH